jgi:hypothetical protein
MEQAADSSHCDGLREKLFEVLSDFCSESQGLRVSLEKLSFPPNSHDYSELLCRRIAETHALKMYFKIDTK